MEGEVERRLKSLDLKGADGSTSNPLINTEAQRRKRTHAGSHSTAWFLGSVH